MTFAKPPAAHEADALTTRPPWRSLDPCRAVFVVVVSFVGCKSCDVREASARLLESKPAFVCPGAVSQVIDCLTD